MLNGLEKTVLKKIAESQLVSKPELKKYLSTTGEDKVIDTITRRLMEQKLITAIAPVGSTCYIITQKGAQALREMEI